MRKSTFLANLLVWFVLLCACVAFQAWYRTGDVDATATAVAGSLALQVGVLFSGPVLMYAMGALAGLAFVWFKKIEMGRGARRACQAVTVVYLAWLLVAALSAPAAGEGVPVPLLAFEAVFYMLPVAGTALGFFYALALAPVDASKPRLFEKYLPDDHFD